MRRPFLRRFSKLRIAVIAIVLLIATLLLLFIAKQKTDWPARTALVPAQEVGVWSSTNIPFVLRTDGPLLIVNRRNYEVRAETPASATNYFYDAGISTVDSASPRHPYVFDVAIPSDIKEFTVSVGAAQGSALRARILDRLSDKQGRIHDPFPDFFWDIFQRLERRRGYLDVTSATWTRTGTGWVEKK